MSAHWFRVPPWVNTIRQGEKATRSEAAIDLLNRWDKGERAHMRMLMEAWGWSHDRISTFVVEVWEWAVENGAVCPPTPLPVNRTKSHGGRTTPAQPPHTDRTHESASNVNNQDDGAQQSHTDRTVTAQSPHAPCARIPLETDVDGRRETLEPIHVPPVPVDTPPLTTPEPPACAPPQAIQASALESTARDATNTQAGLFGQATAATVDSPKKPKKAAAKVDNAEAVGKVWATYRKHHPLCRETIPVSDGKMVAAALKDWSAEQLCRMVDWAHTSKHERALFLQDGGYLGIDNLFRAGKIAARVELAEAEAGPVTRPHQAPEPVAPPEDPAAIWDEVIRLRSRGIRVCPDDIPARTKDAIRAAGGWNQLGLLNEYTERQARTTFITAYRNNIPPVNGHMRNA